MRLTAIELAERLGVPPTAIDAWERGDEPIDDPTLLDRLAALDSNTNPAASEHQAPRPGPQRSSYPDPSEA